MHIPKLQINAKVFSKRRKKSANVKEVAFEPGLKDISKVKLG